MSTADAILPDGPGSAAEESDLATRARGGDEAAFEELVRRVEALPGVSGVAAGIAAAAALHRVVASQLSQLARSDPRVYGGVSLLLLLVAAAAIWLPARRALGVDPSIALRAE